MSEFPALVITLTTSDYNLQIIKLTVLYIERSIVLQKFIKSTVIGKKALHSGYKCRIHIPDPNSKNKQQ